MNLLTASHSDPRVPPTGLARELTLVDNVAIVVGVIIGSAIFLVPSNIARALPAPASVLAVWVIGGVITLGGALSLAELGSMFPGAGGLYTFLRKAFGDCSGFLYTWTFLLLINTGSMAALALAFGVYSAQLMPIGQAAQKMVAVGCVSLLTIINCLGVGAAKRIQNLATLVKIGGIVVMCAVAFARRAPLQANASAGLTKAAFHPGWTQLGVALIAVLWAYEGWSYVTFAGGEMKDPRRDLPRSLLLGTLVVTVAYLSCTLAYYSVLTSQEIAQSPGVAAATMNRLIGPTASVFISGLILVSIVGAINGLMLTGPRGYFAMAVDGLCFPVFARLSPRYHTPTFAIMLQGFWAALLTLSGTYQQLFTAVVFTAWLSYTAAVVAVVVLRVRLPSHPRPYHVPFFPWLPGMFLLAALCVAASAAASEPRHAALAVLLIVSGLPAYALVLRGRRRNHSRNELGSRTMSDIPLGDSQSQLEADTAASVTDQLSSKANGRPSARNEDVF
jgi:APA family basic amino acid/polyamine antiporter